MDYLAEKLAGVIRPVQLTTDPDMNFANKNFKYSSLDFGEVMKLTASGEGEEMFYLRAVSEENPRTKHVKLEKDFPTKASDFVQSNLCLLLSVPFCCGNQRLQLQLGDFF